MDIKSNISSKSYLNFKASPKLQYTINKDIGVYYQRISRNDLAIEKFSTALELNENAHIPLKQMTLCKQQTADIDGALECIEKCIECDNNKIEIQNIRNDCLYEQNNFEKSLIEYYNTKFCNEKARNANLGNELVDFTIQQSIGNQLGPCLNKMRKDIAKYYKHKINKHTDDRPIWKICKENNECDVVSLRSVTVPLVPPLKKKQNDLKLSNRYTLYIDHSTAKDVLFLKKLCTDKRLHIPQIPDSSKKIMNVLSEQLKHVKIFEDMLWQRQPMYSKKYNKDTVKQYASQYCSLKRIQCQARREAFNCLTSIRKLATSNFSAMIKLVDKVMTEFFPFKTNRILARKAEFINEIYNIVGIAFMKRLIVPNTLLQVPLMHRLNILLEIPVEKKYKDISKIEKAFGENKHLVDSTFLVYRQKVEELEKRRSNCTELIERCYLCHELARLHLNQSEMDESKQLGFRIIDLAKLCGNNVWRCLGYLTILRVEYAQAHYVEVAKMLKILINMENIFDEFTRHFIRTAIRLNEDIMAEEQKFYTVNS